MNNDELKNELKKSIEEHKFDSKEKLIDYLNTIYDDNAEDLEKFKFDILQYFDEKNKVELIKPDNIKELNVEDNRFIKYKDLENNTVILENNVSSKPFIDQYNNIQNDLISKDKTIDLKESHDIENEMKRTKIEASLKKENDIDEAKLSNEQRTQLNALKTTTDFKKSNYIMDNERNLFINMENDEAYKTKKNNDGNYEIRKADYNGNEEDEKIKNVSQEEIIQKEINEENKTSKNIEYNEYKNEIDFSGMTDCDLDNLLKSNMINDDNLIKKINDEQKKREEMNVEQKNPMQKEKIKQKTLLYKNYNGFSSLLVLSMITGIGGMSIFLYILMMIG